MSQDRKIRAVPGYGELYWVSPDGEVFKRLRCNHTHHQGYVRVRLQQPGTREKRETKTWLVHRLVAMLFKPNPELLPEVHHVNAIKNDNRADNLEWVTPRQNCLYREERKRDISKDG